MDRVEGAAELVRAGDVQGAERQLGVRMQDVIRTGTGEVGVRFVDDTRVDVTPQSMLTIDEFVYDPATGTGALAIRNSLGTLRYVSGRIAKHSAERVVIRTPTASVAVRGTEFSVSVDEFGRSSFVLLPTCSADIPVCKVGAIEVVTDAGSVLLSQAYQMTVVDTASSAPSVPVTVSLTVPQIANDLILAPPRAVVDGQSGDLDEAVEVSALALDLLAVSELEVDLLDAAELLDNDPLRDPVFEDLLTDPLSELDADLQAELSEGFGNTTNAVTVASAVGDSGTTVTLVSETAAATVNVAAGSAQTLALENDASGTSELGVGSAGGGGLISIVQRQ